MGSFVYLIISLAIPTFTYAADSLANKTTVEDYIYIHTLASKVSQASNDETQINLAKSQLKLEKETFLATNTQTKEISTISEIDSSPQKMRFDFYKIKGQDIYFYNFKDPADFTLMDSRLYAFIELPGQKMLNDYQLYTERVGHPQVDNGGDYSVSDIVRFFNEANNQKIKLNPWELQLQRQLQAMGLIKKVGSKFEVVKESAILGLYGATRGTKEHELNHGIYFTDPAYKQQCNSIYSSLTSQEKQIISRWLKASENEQGDKSLMAREFCATVRDWETLTGLYFEPKNEMEYQLMAKLHRKVLAIDKFSKYYSGQQERGSADNIGKLRGTAR